MTLVMYDSIYPANLPHGADAYLAYTDGEWPTYAAVRAKFPGRHIITLTVTGITSAADGIDCEEGNPNAAEAVAWVAGKLAVEPASRPVAYADLATPGYSMGEIIAGLSALGVPRHTYRVLTAHYTHQPHICGPHTCGGLDTDADGTQWSDQADGLNKSEIDVSLLRDDFFGATHIPAWQEHLMQVLPIIREGSSGGVVRTVQGLCCARGHSVAVDGVFGPATAAAVREVQAAARIVQDSVVGDATWPVLMGIA